MTKPTADERVVARLEELHERWALARLEAIAARDRRGDPFTIRDTSQTADIYAIEFVQLLAGTMVRRPAAASAWAIRFNELRSGPAQGLPWLSDAYRARLAELDA